MTTRLRPDQVTTLSLAAASRSLQTTTSLLTTPAKASALVRRGLLESFEQSDHVRGERRVYYRIYRITEKGRQILREIRE